MVGGQRGGKRAPRVARLPGGRPGPRVHDGRLQRAIAVDALGNGQRGLDMPSGKACARLDLGQLLFEPIRDTPAGPCLDHALRGDVCASSASPARAATSQATVPISLSGCAKGGVRLLEQTVRLAQLIALQVDQGHCDGSRRVRPPDRRTRLAGRDGHCRLGSQLCGAAKPATQTLRQREITEAFGLFVLRTRRRRGRHPRIKDTGRLVKMARPQLNHPAGDQDVGAYPRMPGEHLTRDYADQCLCAAPGRHGGGEIASLPGDGQTEHRGGQPARDLLFGGQTREDGFRGCQRGGTRFALAPGQRRRSGDQVRLGFVPDFAIAACSRTHWPGTGRAAAP